jgi:hypothetical protein
MPKLFGGPFRVASRTSSAGVLGPASVSKSTGRFQSVVAVPTHDLTPSTGACEPDGGPFTG